MSDDELIGIELDEYQLERLLGEGGMARVYLGRDLYLQRYAAIKVISPTFRADPDYLERFEREARAIARLEHPHVVRLYRYGQAKGLLYMAMQFVEGSDLGSLLRGYRQSSEHLEVDEATRLIREIGTALDYIHSQGIIHRDVKSSNILLDRTGRSYLTDFGLALLTQVGTRGEIFGSPHYLAPEQAISSAKAVPQSDLYSLGVIAWEMLTGQLPFDAKDPLELAMQHMSQEPPRPRSLRPELPARLEAVLLKALEKKPEDRYQSGAELAEAVEAALAVSAIPLEPPPTSKTIPERVALHMADRPLPPIPAAMTPPPPPAIPAAAGFPGYGESDTQPGYVVAGEEETVAGGVEIPGIAPPAQPPRSPHLSQPGRAAWVPVAWAALVGVCVLGACLILFNIGRAGWRNAQQAGSPALAATTPTRRAGSATILPANPTAPLAGATPTAAAIEPDASPTSRPVAQPTVVPLPPPTSNAVTVLITRCRDGHCLGIINQGQVDLPLAGLLIEGDDFEYSGRDWDLAHLPPGGCLVLTGNARRWAPTDRACQDPAGTLVSDEDFWKEKLEVSYAGETLGECRKNQNTCEFVIALR